MIKGLACAELSRLGDSPGYVPRCLKEPAYVKEPGLSPCGSTTAQPGLSPKRLIFWEVV